jgi:hypothetical protein
MLTIEQLKEVVKELNDSDFGRFLRFRVRKNRWGTGIGWTSTKEVKGFPLQNNEMKAKDFTYGMTGKYQGYGRTDEEFIEETKKNIKEIVENLKENLKEKKHE